MSRIHEEVLQFNNKKTKNQIGHRTSIDFSPKKMYMWPRSTGRDA